MVKASVCVCLLLLLFFISWEVLSVKATVTYDSKGLIIDGKKRILFSGSVHYPRSPPEMWPDIIQKAKDGGLDVIDTYVFWNGHEPTQGQYNFEGRFDLIRFLKVVQKAGLYVSLRIGPYACAEWNFGGFPVWLKYIPGIEFRTINGPFQAEMQKFTQKIVSMLKEEKMFQPQGGPVILSQIENEYELVEWELGPTGRAYTQWAAEMAVGLNTSVPWIMCKQESAPDPVINTCNGYYCEGFVPNKPYKPKFATELWTGWVQLFGGPTPYRPVEDLTYSVAKFVANGGSYSNYYMYYGGTSFDRNSGAFVATSYHYGAPIDEYGLPIEPNWSHLRNMHLAMKACEPALVSSDPIVTWPGRNQEVRVFKSASGACAAFLGNYDEVLPQKVTFGDMQYDLPPWSISILPDCKTEVFNTAKVTVPTTQKQMIPVGGFTWESYVEGVASFTGNRTFTKDGLWEQLDMTRDKTDYLWYMTEVNIDPSEAFLNNGKDPILSIRSGGHVLNVFINDQPAGVAHGNLGFPEASFSQPVKLTAGVNKISILSAIVGLQNIGLHFEKLDKGVIGPVSLSGLNEGTRDLSRQKWTYQVGLSGEALGLPYAKDSSFVKWVEGTSIVVGQPLMWYKTTFDSPAGNEPLALDMGSMQKGLIWINGQNIGRHWPAFKSINIGECNGCSYAGLMDATKCVTNCGQPSQIWYHVPRAWLKPKGNQLVVFEEWGGDPTKISLVKRIVT